MNDFTFCTAGSTPALEYAQDALQAAGFSLTTQPGAGVTHLLLPVPSFDSEGNIKGGGSLPKRLAQLPEDITVIGGNLDQPQLEGYRCLDLLKDPLYTARNAAITAHCALALAMERLPVTLDGQRILVIGWGRIGKCLGQLLRGLGARVTIAARKESDRVMLKALGYGAEDTANLSTTAYRVVFNTVPQMVCPDCPGKALKVDLASRPGLGGADVIWARGLPGTMTPESSGQLIAGSVIRLLKEGSGV